MIVNKLKVRTSFQHWLLCVEIAIVILFVLLIVVYTDSAQTQTDIIPILRVQEFVSQGDQFFLQQDLIRATLAYWHAIRAFHSQSLDSAGAVSTLTDSLLHANLRVAEIYAHSNWIKDARARLEEAARLRANHVSVHLLRGKLARIDGNPLLAVQEFLAVIEKEPTNPEAHYLLGIMYQGTQQYEEAIHHYKEAIANDPELTRLPFENAPTGLLARLQLSRTYRRSLQNYRFIDRHLSDGEITNITQMHEQAMLMLEEAIEKDASFTEARDELVGLLYRRAAMTGREAETRPYDKALKIYERIVEISSHETDAWKQIGEINLVFMQEKEAALQAYKMAYKLEPNSDSLATIKNIEQDLMNRQNQ